MAENPYKRKKFEAGGELNKSTGLYGDGGGKKGQKTRQKRF